ncbi:alpha/beta hydrolase-fold protein [Paenibacillus vortex]|uniref:alpha/beta hydrolase-fold protein n=1 Tax=Paenibacillus vortex TaxID=71995 RepID=UPI003AF2148F
MVSMSSRMVEIADFPSVNLGNTRSLYVYLPPSYHVNTEKRYAVLYMHDGQHVFSADVTGESWEMHETADRTCFRRTDGGDYYRWYRNGSPSKTERILP